MLNKGRTAPDFALPGVEGGEPALYELFRPIEDGELVLLWFLTATFLPTGTAELRAITEAGWHDCAGLQVWVLTMDSIYAAATYADQHEFPRRARRATTAFSTTSGRAITAAPNEPSSSSVPTGRSSSRGRSETPSNGPTPHR